MDKIGQQLELIQKWHWDNYVHYNRAFSRYLLIGGGASIGLILNFLNTKASPHEGFISFDTSVWLFTFNILIAGLCIFLNSQFSALNVNNFSRLIGYNAGRKVGSTSSVDLSKLNDELSVLSDEQENKVKKFWKVIVWLQGLAAVLFSVGLLLSVFLATKLL